MLGAFGNADCNSDSTKFLLLDNRIIEKTYNVLLEVGKVEKHPANPLFGEDKHWEKRFDNLYGNVIYDREEKIYKCWYSPFIQDESATGMTLSQRNAIKYRPPDNREMAICYATSADGLSWEKPEMNLVDFEGSKGNNILWRGGQEREELWGGPHGAGIFKDLVEPDPDRRYKAIIKADILSVAFSAGGVHWGPAKACPEADVPGDTHNNAFWAPTLNKYVCITRDWGAHTNKNGLQVRKDEFVNKTFTEGNEERVGRQVSRTESEDFINWSRAEVVLEGIDLDHQTYAMPVFFYGGVYLGLLAIHQQSTDRVWTELTWSPDTRNWYRISPGTPLIPNSEKELDYDYGGVYACASPVILEDKIMLYYGGSDWLHFGWRNGFLCLATLRPDGFAGYVQENSDQKGVIQTKLIDYNGGDLKFTADVENGGSINISIFDSDGKLITTTETITNTITDEMLQLDNKIEEENISLKIEIIEAKAYSFSIE